ncbi:hypothetical protein HBI79_122220 [Parastagonospora nodorum]|nr:hypothetical protein HBI79_122220 [Parastagonospora nodorum]KAH5324064.1 hypothetical protein HBI12_090880 [Parastagonospora nodorum]
MDLPILHAYPLTWLLVSVSPGAQATCLPFRRRSPLQSPARWEKRKRKRPKFLHPSQRLSPHLHTNPTWIMETPMSVFASLSPAVFLAACAEDFSIVDARHAGMQVRLCPRAYAGWDGKWRV